MFVQIKKPQPKQFRYVAEKRNCKISFQENQKESAIRFRDTYKTHTKPTFEQNVATTAVAAAENQSVQSRSSSSSAYVCVCLCVIATDFHASILFFLSSIYLDIKWM